MRNIILGIFILFPTFIFSQENLTFEKRNEIQKVVKDFLKNYEKHIKGSTRNEDEFYELFTDSVQIIDDVLPSKTFSENIDANQLWEIMRGNRMYNVNTEIIKYESYNPITSDSGFVNVIVRKNVTSSWNDKTKKEFNIVIDEDNNKITQKVIYKNTQDLKFKIYYNLDADFIKCRIKSISKIDDLNKKNIYVMYYKPGYLLGKTKLIDRQIIDNWENNKLNNEIKGSAVKYLLMDDKISLENYEIVNLRKPKIGNLESKNPLVKKIIFTEKNPLRINYSFLTTNRSSIFDYGTNLEIDNIEYSETANLSLKFNLFPIELSKFKLMVGFRVNYLNSTTSINSDYIETITELPNPITNNENTYFRKNSIYNFSEDLSFNQLYGMGTVDVNLSKYVKGLSLHASVSLLSNSTVTSSRQGTVTYSGIFQDNFNIEISEPIDYIINGNMQTLDLGTEEFSEDENIDFTNVIGLLDMYDVGISYKIFNPISINLYRRTYSKDLFTKTKNELSSNRNEFNSFSEVTNFLKHTNKIYIGITYNIKF